MLTVLLEKVSNSDESTIYWEETPAVIPYYKGIWKRLCVENERYRVSVKLSVNNTKLKCTVTDKEGDLVDFNPVVYLKAKI